MYSHHRVIQDLQDLTYPPTRGQLPERDTFSWTVLSALAGEVDTGLDDERRVWIRLRKRRGAGAAWPVRRAERGAGHDRRQRRPGARTAGARGSRRALGP
jgi:hypothetical protein